jgi:hypothetical protein
MHDPVESALLAAQDSVPVVQQRRTVHAQPDREACRIEQVQPLLIEQRPVRLKRVRDALIRASIALLEPYRLAIKVLPQEQRLPAVPDEVDVPLTL